MLVRFSVPVGKARPVGASCGLPVQPLVQALDLGHRLVEPELVALPALCCLAESPPRDRIVQQARDFITESDEIAWRDEYTLAFVLEDRRDAAHAARDDGLACCHPLEDRQRHALETRGENENVHRGQEVRHVGVRTVPEEEGRDAELGGEALEPPSLGPVTHHDEPKPREVRGQPAQCTQRRLELFSGRRPHTVPTTGSEAAMPSLALTRSPFPAGRSGIPLGM